MRRRWPAIFKVGNVRLGPRKLISVSGGEAGPTPTGLVLILQPGYSAPAYNGVTLTLQPGYTPPTIGGGGA